MPYSSRLTIGAVASYLLKKQLLTPKQIVDDGLLVIEVSRRNRSYRVHNSGAISYLLKQGVGSERALTVANEASTYEFFNSGEGNAQIREIVPEYYYTINTITC